jgi:hypothetical protein
VFCSCGILRHLCFNLHSIDCFVNFISICNFINFTILSNSYFIKIVFNNLLFYQFEIFTNFKFKHVRLSTCKFNKLQFQQLSKYKLDISSTSQLSISQFHQLSISSLCNFINLKFHQFVISSTCQLFILTFHQHAIS